MTRSVGLAAHARASSPRTVPHNAPRASALATPPTGQSWRSHYYAGSTRLAMRVQTSSAPDVVYYLHADHLRSTSLTTDAGGNRVGELRYTPDGGTRYTWGSTPTDRRFTGQREEAGLGSLYDYGARFYSPYLARFVSADTIVPNPSHSNDLNRHAYAANNPLSLVDCYRRGWRSGHRVDQNFVPRRNRRR